MRQDQELLRLFGGQKLLENEYPLAYKMLRNAADRGAGKPLHKTGGDDARDIYANIHALFSDEQGVVSKVCSDFLDKKAVIAAGVVMSNATTGQVLETFYAYQENINFYAELFSSINKWAKMAKADELKAKATFVWANQDGTTEQTEREVRANNYYQGLPIIEDTAVEKPRAKNGKLTIVLYDRTARSGETPDYVYEHVKIDNNHVKVMMPFKGEVIVSPDWKINSVCDDTSGLFKPQLNLGLVTGGVVEYGNVQGIAPQFKIDGNKIIWDFADDWNCILDLSRFTVQTTLEFYCCFTLEVENKQGIKMYPVIVVNSDPAKEGSGSSAFIEPINIRWGCVAKDTMIHMADGSMKAICRINIGDRVKDQDGGAALVVNVLTGSEDGLVFIKTAAGKELRATKGHPIKTARGFIRADSLNAADRIITDDGEAGIKELFMAPYNDTVYSLELETPKAIICNGIIAGDYHMQNTLQPKNQVPPYSEETLALQREMKQLIDHLNSSNGR